MTEAERNAVLEEAARVAEGHDWARAGLVTHRQGESPARTALRSAAAAIRARKSPFPVPERDSAEARVERLQKAVEAGRSDFDLAKMSDEEALKILSRRDSEVNDGS